MSRKPTKKLAATYDVEAEQALLGALIVNQKLIVHAAGKLASADLYDPLHQAIFDLLVEQDEAGKVISPITLATWLKHHEGFEKVGGVNYLSNMALGSSADTRIEGMDVRHIEQIAETLAECATRRLAIAALDDAKLAVHEDQPVDQALAPLAIVADEIAARRADDAQGERFANQVSTQLLREVERQAVSERAHALPTGLRELDKIIGGLIPSHAIFIGGRPGMGKTIVGAEFCVTAAQHGWEPDYFSLEMPARELGARMLSSFDYRRSLDEGYEPFHYDKLIQMRPTQEHLSRAARINAEYLQPLPIEIFDFEDVTMSRIAAICRARAAKAARRGVRKLFVIDHLGLIEPDERYRGRKVDELSLITKRTKQLAKKTGCPVVMLAQLNREVEGREDKRPRISDFRDSGTIEQDADVLIGLYRHDYYATQAKREASHKGQAAQTNAETEAERLYEVLEMLVLKNRSSKTGTATCHVKVECGALLSERPGPRLVRQNDIFSTGEALGDAFPAQGLNDLDSRTGG